ncbi:MAG: acyl-CoA dehydrogenase family protein [Actinomycetota bacterium]
MLRQVDELVADVLTPVAEEVDRAADLPVGHFSALADLGLYGLVVPPSAGGLGCPPKTVRAVFRRLGSGCGATAFAFAQHHGTIGAVAGTANTVVRDRWLPKLVDNRLAGIGYAHLRRGGPPVLSAKPDGDGWTLDGTAPWVTSWGLAEAFAVAARGPEGELVWVLVPGTDVDGMTAGPRFDLMVFGATQTVPLHFDGYRVGADSILSVVDFDTWAVRDRQLAARPNPLSVGIGDRALRLLAEREPGLAEEFTPWWDDVVERAEAQCVLVDRAARNAPAAAETETVSADTLTADTLTAETAAARAELLTAVQRLTTALIASIGGSAMEHSHPAQRLSREAMFYVVQAQTADGRAASLQRIRDDHGR